LSDSVLAASYQMVGSSLPSSEPPLSSPAGEGGRRRRETPRQLHPKR
jgi:hypothetical protein